MGTGGGAIPHRLPLCIEEPSMKASTQARRKGLLVQADDFQVGHHYAVYGLNL